MNKQVPNYATRLYKAFLIDKRPVRMEDENEFIVLYAKIPTTNRRIIRVIEDWEFVDALLKKSRKT